MRRRYYVIFGFLLLLIALASATTIGATLYVLPPFNYIVGDTVVEGNVYRTPVNVNGSGTCDVNLNVEIDDLDDFKIFNNEPALVSYEVINESIARWACSQDYSPYSIQYTIYRIGAMGIPYLLAAPPPPAIEEIILGIKESSVYQTMELKIIGYPLGLLIGIIMTIIGFSRWKKAKYKFGRMAKIDLFFFALGIIFIIVFGGGLL